MKTVLHRPGWSVAQSKEDSPGSKPPPPPDPTVVPPGTVKLGNALTKALAVVDAKRWEGKPCRLKPIPARTVYLGEQLKEQVVVEDRTQWKGKVSYAFDSDEPRDHPRGSAIDEDTGDFTWTPGEDPGPGDYNAVVFAWRLRGPEPKTTISIKVKRPLHLSPIDRRIAMPGELLSETITVKGAEHWDGKGLSYGLGPDRPPGAEINLRTGLFTWTPAKDLAPCEYKFRIYVKSLDDQNDEMTFTIKVVRPIRLKRFLARTVAAGGRLTVPSVVENAGQWKPEESSYSVTSNDTPGAEIDRRSGIFSWCPPPGQAADDYDVAVSVEGPDGQADTKRFVVTVVQPNVVRPPPQTGRATPRRRKP